MINKVEAAAGRFTFLPPGRHRAEVHPRHALACDVPGYPGGVPGGHPAAQVVELDLALLCCQHPVAFGQIVRLVQNCPRQKPKQSNYSYIHT